MMCTIMVGRYSSVQGQYVRSLPDGRMVVQVGQHMHVGRPITAAPSTAA